MTNWFPNFSKRRSALRTSLSGYIGKTFGAKSTTYNVTSSLSIWNERHNSSFHSPNSPAISTPVNPAPTVTNVSNSRRFSLSDVKAA